MRIPFQCPQCKVTGKAPAKFAGQIIACPKCKGMLRVPLEAAEIDIDKLTVSPVGTAQAATFEPPPGPAAPPVVATSKPRSARQSVAPAQPAAPPKRFFNPRPWLTAAAVGAAVAFLVTMRAEGAGLVHYLSLLLAIGALGYRVAYGLAKPWIYWTAMLAAILVAIRWYRSDYYVSYWDESDNAGRRYYTDYLWRSTDKMFYRKYYARPAAGGTFHAEGGFSESGKQHGPWKSFSSADYSQLDTEWFWYGEAVSEGEWHLRVK